jgi:hypothetical protein
MDKSQKVTMENLPEKSKTATTTLRDSLGTVSFYIPARFDTSFTWTNYSDCGKPCNHEQYRYQPKTHPIFKESGFYYDIPDILIDQFTIVHSSYFPFHDGDTSMNVGRHENFKSRRANDPINGTIVRDTIEKINDRYFSVESMNGYDKEGKNHFAKLAALTTIKSNEIEFHYDIKTKDTINLKEFYQNSIKLLRTVRMSNGI